MHLLQAQPGAPGASAEPVDLGQTPGEIVLLSSADTDLMVLSRARTQLGARVGSVRLANLMHLSHPMSVDLYVENIIVHAKIVIVRLLGGVGYWPYGVEQIREACQGQNIPLVIVPGDDQPDPELAAASTVAIDVAHRIWQYFVHGGAPNAQYFLSYACSLIDPDARTAAERRDLDWREPSPLPRAGAYHSGTYHCGPREAPSRSPEMSWIAGAPAAGIVFYRAHMQAGNLDPIDALVSALRARGVNAVPVFCASLKEPVAADTVAHLLEEAGVEIVLNTTGFALSTPGQARAQTPFDRLDCPILQVVLSGDSEDNWRKGTTGLSARDIAMNVALPEVDGRVLSRAVSFKGEARYDPETQCSIVAYQSRADRVGFVADLAHAWLTLRATPVEQRKVAIVLANYPNRDARIGNGVGLDTPAATITVLEAMHRAGYRVDNPPSDGAQLIDALLRGPTNAAVQTRRLSEWLPRASYARFFAGLPLSVRTAVTQRWGAIESDPFYLANQRGFAIPALRFGNVFIGVQPARGYNIEPQATYHDPALVPPHGYLAFYAWLRQGASVHALVHMGKHGNLEWLPGRSIALGADCFPEAALGPLPHIYPFIVNDPGEGSQAKRRSQAVIIDHLTPPLTRAESYGPLADLEALVDEYYEAASIDPRRLPILREGILELTRSLGLDRDCGINADDPDASALHKLDGFLCEIKELQIRDGLHIFGRSPVGDQLDELIVALCRLPRGDGEGANASLLRALAHDLGFSTFDPLDCDLAAPWTGPRPNRLATFGGSWRTAGDTVERLEVTARALVAGGSACPSGWSRTEAVLTWVSSWLRPNLQACGEQELGGLLNALAGRFVEPGPSGAPSRGRPEVLPTGRNFYSVDTRTVPTPAAWKLGWKSACLLVERYRQEQGAWPQRLALSAWGTSNMRTGGDDISQALALLGARPTWDSASRRVTGFEILPAGVLDRPRVDVTLRISGFFRDAFPGLIDLFDAAARAVSALDEDDLTNPLAARVKAETAELIAQGESAVEAGRRAGHRVFGSMPGAYGAGLQALIDEKGWEEDADLSRAYIAWGGYAYGEGVHGAPEQRLFAARLGGVEAVIHNQDNREHDLLDSDDYYQFEGGMTAAVRHLSGRQPVVYHNDHSRPESPKIRRLEEEIARVVRARVVNPKWIQGVMRHGYKGAFEMAATVDYLFAFSATTRAVGDHHFDAVFSAYLDDTQVVSFLETNNPGALRDIAERLLEALDRGLWRPRLNSTHVALRQLARHPDPPSREDMNCTSA